MVVMGAECGWQPSLGSSKESCVWVSDYWRQLATCTDWLVYLAPRVMTVFPKVQSPSLISELCRDR